MSRGRGQASLLALGVALLLVTGALGVALAATHGAFAAVDRDAADARLADSLAARAVAPDGPFSDRARANVLDGAALRNASAADLGALFPAARGHAVRIALDGDVVAAAGDASAGATSRRLVLVTSAETRTYGPRFETGTGFALRGRVDALDVTLTPPNGTRVTAVRVGGRVALSDPRGLAGAYRVAVSPYRNASVAVDADGPLPAGSVVLVAHGETTRTAVLEVRARA
ncbi:hypothetical protein J2752_002036 [Halarchaeum rubridurum]|uniref:Uncharacterized protein n=1 Tax=Halarchaeum rubridurum TaxID=489911 RepID=A0A830G040_9EURY|nr:hypothetical protein [Halarchaeum rubridurum]MBP1955124.1 hypothetical protein [Halarchaeum rubridurum]GGM68765.1 hypothetical protein GCM10009017_18710 [Halarchaeum rubridurum]